MRLVMLDAALLLNKVLHIPKGVVLVPILHETNFRVCMYIWT